VLLALDYFTEKGFKSVMGAPTRHKADEGFFFYIIDRVVVTSLNFMHVHD
jgi:catechol 2,3-dioxygenase